MLLVMVDQSEAWLSAREASARLGVKLETLYAYASRGLVTSLRGLGPRGRLYATDDVERLRTRHVARSGHGPVAASALRFGEPVLETRVSRVDAAGLYYRGHSASALCRSDVGFERVAELLWTGVLPDSASRAERPVRALSCDAARLWPLMKGSGTLAKMSLLLSTLALTDNDRHGASDAAEH